MERLAYTQLVNWKNSSTRKPLILQGARQVGTTWLLQEFAKKEYKNMAYISCEKNERMQELFSDYDTEAICVVNEENEPLGMLEKFAVDHYIHSRIVELEHKLAKMEG